MLVWLIYWTLRKRSVKTRFKVIHTIISLIYRLWRGGRARLRRNLSLIRPDLEENEIERGSWRVIETLAWTWAIMLGNEYMSPSEVKEMLELEGIEKFLEYYHGGKKLIIVADHVGLFDQMVRIGSLFGLRGYVPVEPIKPAWRFKLVARLRAYSADILFEPTEKGKTLARAAAHLADGRIVFLMIDVPTQEGSGVPCRIGASWAKFPVGAVKLALEQDATIFPFLPSWTRDQKVKVVIGPPFELTRTGDLNQDIELNTRRLVEELFAPHIQENWDSWLRSLWSNLSKAPE